MTLTSKQARRAAAQAEAQRRWRAAEEQSPLSREHLLSMLNAVAVQVADDGHDHSFSYVNAWLARHSITAAPVLSFLNEHNVHDDYGLIVGGDPYTLFGPTNDRLRWMPIEREDLQDLLASTEDLIEEHGCDHTHRFTRKFLASRSLPLGATEMALLAQGGGCDCEVVLNVDAETIYPARAGAQNRS